MIEYMERDGLKYKRRGPSDLYPGRFWIASDKQPNPTDKPEIACECGSVTFTLIYGDYEVFARCTSCGVKESIYSG